MVTNKEIEGAVLEKYPKSTIERGINLSIVEGYEKILGGSFVLKLTSNQRNYEWLLGPAFIATLPITIPIAVYRDKQYEEGVEIKSVDVLGDVIESKYYELPYFKEYVGIEARKRNIDMRNHRGRPMVKIDFNNGGSAENVLDAITHVNNFVDLVKNKHDSIGIELLEIYEKNFS